MLAGMSLPSLPVVLFAFAALCALLALLQLRAARRRWRGRRRFAATHRMAWGLVFLLLGLLGTGAGLGLLGWQRLTAEAPVATIEARAVAPQRYAVVVTTPDGLRQEVEISGDEWQIDARVIKWRSTAVALGAPPLYRLDRIGGRWRDIAREREAPRSVVALAPEAWPDLWELKRRHPRWLPWVDADYGSAAYLALVDGGRYTVTLAAAGGLVARPADEATRAKLALP